MSSHINSRTTEGIRVVVRTLYLAEKSSPRHQYYVFGYLVEITNQSTERVQLMSREWHITDGFGNKKVVEGEGVIGQQPVIDPGETYHYSSGSHFQSTVGKMTGYYYMTRLRDNQEIKVEIPPFVMEVPSLLN
jgi:ApaG protein